MTCEYKVWEVGSWSPEYLAAFNKLMDHELNLMGKEDWKLVAISGSGRRDEKWIFMREDQHPCAVMETFCGE